MVEPERETELATGLPILVAREVLVTAQKKYSLLPKCWVAVVMKSKCNNKQPFFTENGVLMHRWVSTSHAANKPCNEVKVYKVVVPDC